MIRNNTPQHYTRPTTTPHTLLATIERVAARFDVEPPVNVRGVEQVVAAEPTPAQVVTEAATASLSSTDPQAWLEDAVARYLRAQAVAEIRVGLRTRHDKLSRTLARQLTESIAPELHKRAAAVITRMTKAAASLPAGAEALDAEAVIVADAATQRSTVTAALADLAALASIYETHGPIDGVTPRLLAVLPVVDLPNVETEQTHRLTRDPINPSTERDAVRRLADDLERHGTDLALVGIARGDYTGVSLSWASSATEVAARGQTARGAFMHRVVDGPAPRPRETTLVL